MTTKDISKELGGLIEQANNAARNNNPFDSPGSYGAGAGQSAPPVYGSPEDSIPDELQDEPIFEIDYKSEQERCIDKAKRSIMIVVREVVPEAMQDSELIIDKIDQDAEQLGNLYYQYIKKETYHQALMDLIARGNHNVKMFETCEKISRSLEDLGSKINELQNQFRKYYIDTYMDMQHKEQEDEYNQENPDFKKVEAPKRESAPALPTSLDNRIVGTETVTKTLNEQKKQRLKAMAMAETKQAEEQ